ncbi:DUF4238 domain-containing protein [Salinibacterium sp. ZJ454]|uniref:DUF4238 domain-containing protein n=1 Tax=Salinibacterium sp. ZJ454 TaxID=2708339 RepID=UPI0014214B66|nr:DUF4238 domain-containing protein [Salinibacterium sp. ZJ454]
MKRAKENHHVIPQFYLKRFADESRTIRETDIASKLAQIIPVKRATVRKHFYTLDGSSGEQLDTLEDFFSLVEDYGARAFNEILDKGVWPLHGRTRKGMAYWIAAQFLRSPRSRSALDRSMNQLRTHLESLGPAEVRSMLRGSSYSDSEADIKWQETLDYYRTSGPQPRNAQARWFAGLLEDTTKGSCATGI